MGIEVIFMIEGLSIPSAVYTVITNLKDGEYTVLTSDFVIKKQKIIEEIPEDFDIFLSDGFLARLTKKDGINEQKFR
jgi:hypothetical protein